jgi:hypothetical protein
MLVAVLALVLAAAPAQASVADQFVPGAEGMRASRSAGGAVQLSFTAKAYSAVAGRRATVRCVIARDTGVSWSVDTLGVTRTLPRKRQTVSTGATGKLDLCVLGTRRTSEDMPCLVVSRSNAGPCARNIVVLTDTGRSYLDWLLRAVELERVSFLDQAWGDMEPQGIELMRGVFGPDVVALPGPDATPPPGKVGYHKLGTVSVVAAQLQDGRRKFVRYDGEVVSTNFRQALPDKVGTLSMFSG